jgi:hypothetical protein
MKRPARTKTWQVWRVWLLLASLVVAVWLHAQPVQAEDTGNRSLYVADERIMLIPVPIHRMCKVLQVVDVVNRGPVDADISIALPDGYKDFQVEDRTRRATVANGTAVFPKAAKAKSTTTVSVSYTLPLDVRNGAQLTLHAVYDVDAAHIYLPIGDYALSAQGLLTTTQTATVDGTQFRVFTRLGIPAGDDWAVRLQHLPAATAGASVNLPVIGAPISERQNMLQASANLLLAAVVLAIGLIGIRSAGQTGAPSRSRQEALVAALERIELDFALGRLAENVYRRRKQDILQKIAETKNADQAREGRG